MAPFSNYATWFSPVHLSIRKYCTIRVVVYILASYKLPRLSISVGFETACVNACERFCRVGASSFTQTEGLKVAWCCLWFWWYELWDPDKSGVSCIVAWVVVDDVHYDWISVIVRWHMIAHVSTVKDPNSETQSSCSLAGGLAGWLAGWLVRATFIQRLSSWQLNL